MPRRHNRRHPRKRYTEPNKISLAELYMRDGGKCHRCKQPVVSLQDANREHIIPKSRGGRNGTNFENIALIHKWCNSSRGHEVTWEETLVS